MNWSVDSERLDFTQLYLRFKYECLLAVMVSVGDHDTARELVAEAFARAWASWPRVCEHPAPQAWVVRTALNVGISRCRRRRRELTVADPGVFGDSSTPGQQSDGVDPAIRGALMRLPVRQRQFVALRLFLDLDTARTAEVLGVAPGTVQAHLGRAVAALREELTHHLKEESVS